MIITYYGTSCFKIQSGDMVLAFDPPSKDSVIKAPRFQTDIVFSSHDHPRHNGINNLSSKDKEHFFTILGPGEYEIKGMYIKGVSSFHDSVQGKKYGANTIYTADVEDITICHLGDFGEKELRDETLAEINGVDILFVPIGGDTVLNPACASRVINQITPRIIVPIHYEIEKKQTKILTEFFNEMGIEKNKPIDKLTIKKRDMSAEDKTQIIVLESSLSN